MVYSNAHLLWSQEFKLAVGFKEMIWMAAADLCWYLLKAGLMELIVNCHATELLK